MENVEQDLFDFEMVKVGQEVPDFKMAAFQDDEIKDIKLSDYKGKWVVLMFYPAYVLPGRLYFCVPDRVGRYGRALSEVPGSRRGSYQR